MKLFPPVSIPEIHRLHMIAQRQFSHEAWVRPAARAEGTVGLQCATTLLRWLGPEQARENGHALSDGQTRSRVLSDECPQALGKGRVDHGEITEDSEINANIELFLT